MNIEKELDALNENILCNHKTISYRGNFFHNHDGYELFLLLNGDLTIILNGSGCIWSMGILSS
jgi:hypothetical protein